MKTFINQNGQKETEEELKEKYNPEGSSLRNLQIESLKMLIWLSDICKENNIEWYLAYGNILGAVRHGGFIPWDDDLDICLLEKDYKKLKKVLSSKKYADSEYILQNHKTDKGYYAFWSVLRHKNSEYIKNDRIHNARKYRGFQIDVFPLAEKRLQFLAKIIKKFETLNNKYFIGKNNFYNIVAGFLYYFERYLLIPIYELLCFLLGWKNKGILCHAYPTPFFKERMKKSYVFPLKTITFEGHEFPAPNNIDEYLKSLYGDNYMILPTKEKRNNHTVLEYRLK